mmetsp:Transcript_53690/g.114031  ORF Transcript_53690/g.114031 Transcript_53690/m.114031 type:complete len:202 (+) Transcript_53690:594-1199(+)
MKSTNFSALPHSFLYRLCITVRRDPEEEVFFRDSAYSIEPLNLLANISVPLLPVMCSVVPLDFLTPISFAFFSASRAAPADGGGGRIGDGRAAALLAAPSSTSWGSLLISLSGDSVPRGSDEPRPIHDMENVEASLGAEEAVLCIILEDASLILDCGRGPDEREMDLRGAEEEEDRAPAVVLVAAARGFSSSSRGIFSAPL